MVKADSEEHTVSIESGNVDTRIEAYLYEGCGLQPQKIVTSSQTGDINFTFLSATPQPYFIEIKPLIDIYEPAEYLLSIRANLTPQ